MNTLSLLILCLSGIISIAAVATIFVNGWVKAVHIQEIKQEVKELWDKVSAIGIIENKIENIGRDINEIKEILRK